MIRRKKIMCHGPAVLKDKKMSFIYFFNLENGQTEMIVMMVGRQWKTIKGGRMKRKNDK